jgi:hypothetical protein
VQQASSPRHAPTAEAATEPAPRSERRARIELGRLPLPLVDVTVAGFPTRVVIDTGATRTVIADWLALQASIDIRRSETRVADHTGQPVAVVEAVDPRLVISGWGPVTGGPAVLVAQFPDVLQRLGIGGLLAPQLLARSGEAIVIDLPRRELAAIPSAGALGRYGSRGVALVAPGAASLCQASGQEAPLFVVPATVAGRSALLELNTGAADSDIEDGSEPGRALASGARAGERTFTASGSFGSRTLGPVALVVGAFQTTSEVLLVPDNGTSSCRRDGFLGMSALRDCVLVLDGPKTFVRCG